MELEKENWALNLIPALEYEVDENLNKIFEDENYTKNY